MIKMVLMAGMVAAFGALGFFGERFVRPAAAPPVEAPSMPAKKALLFNMPLGRFTMQVAGPEGTLHHVIDVDVYVAGAGSFQKINGAVGRAKLRDATISALTVLSRSEPYLDQPLEEDAQQAELAAQIVRKLHVTFPDIMTARIKAYSHSFSATP